MATGGHGRAVLCIRWPHHHDSHHQQAAVPERLKRQERMVDGAKGRSRDEHDRQTQSDHQVRHRLGVVQRNEHAAGSLHHPRTRCVVRCVSQDRILLNFPADLTFDFNRDTVKSQFVGHLHDAASVMRDYPQTTVDVLGHADSVGADAYNQDLSERRAMNVSSVLIQGGVIRERVIATGFGETRPVADNGTDSGRARNRRVEVMISAFQG